MKPKILSTSFILPLAGLIQPAAQATTYLNVEQAQQVLLPKQKLQIVELEVSEEIRKKVATESGVRWPKVAPKFWRSNSGEWFILDRVLGKHEDIIYAMALDSNGKVLGLEILEYRESYGSEVREADWRAQFTGKSAVSELTFNQTIKNITGATLSSRHLMEGVKRFLSLYQHQLKSYVSPSGT